MIEVKNNKDIDLKFNDINEYYSWVSKNNDFDNLETNNKDAKDLLEFFKFYNSTKKLCELEINKNNESFIEKTDNKLVIEAEKELVRMNSNGKFLRACLIALGYFSNNNTDLNYCLPLTSAYETFQTSILIHDDIIDNASLRRGKITIPKSYNMKFDSLNDETYNFKHKSNHISNSMGLCIGDLGFYLASKIIINNYKDNSNFIDILNLYNKIVVNTIKGEIIDVILPFKEEFEKGLSKEKDVMEIYKLKTAWYSIIGPFELGMVLANYKENEISRVEDMLYSLGVAFQIKDDILGVFGDEKELGKSSSSDISEYKQTLLYTYVSENNEDMLEKLNKYYGKENLSISDIKNVKKIFEESGALEYSNDMMNNMFDDSRKKLEKLDFFDEKIKSILRGFITYLDLRIK